MEDHYNSKLVIKLNEIILIQIYKIMVLIRKFEEKIIELYSEQEMRCPVHLCIGHEAIPAGVCENLNKGDVVFSNHRSHGHYIAKGGDIKRMLAEIYGKVTGCSKGRGGSMHLIDLSANFLASTPIVGGTIPLAAGAALASKMQNKSNVSVAFFGDAAVEEGTLHETLNFASLHKLPVLFVCENNLYSTQTHINERQPAREIVKVAEGHGIKAFRGDGNNAIEVYETAKNAIEHIKSGNGPVFLEFLTYRFREHCGPNEDVSLGYRTKEEILEWTKKDPIKKLGNKLLDDKIATNEELEKIEHDTGIQIEQAVSFAKESQFPKKDSMDKNVYSE
ncbi:thiamine pyrophosphate-dependent dehydrogenase E1 component subunit alpha [Candidatus Woesearchaeota archaeon]|nr:thiamine pyrophosphate-dependent dehydrogenase E1 component subunit alpha [Candidatus Woesearchaeota archaeon]